MLSIIKETGFFYDTYSLELEENPKDVLCSLCVERERIWNKKEYIPDYAGKNVLFISNFNTRYNHRNKGYARYLLQEIIKRFKDDYDLIHLNACPYYIENDYAVYEAPDNGLDMERLIKFYESFGFEIYGDTIEGFKAMILKKK
jgi:GNAT superfamily N-acetyltransferase